MATPRRFEAVALLTKSELELLGKTLQWVVPIEEMPAEFDDLLAKIDKAEDRRRAR